MDKAMGEVSYDDVIVTEVRKDVKVWCEMYLLLQLYSLLIN